jgi:hypothetical protein
MACRGIDLAAALANRCRCLWHRGAGPNLSSRLFTSDPKRLPGLDPSHVRAEFERRFTARHMAEDYVRNYHLLLENRSGRGTVL